MNIQQEKTKQILILQFEDKIDELYIDDIFVTEVGQTENKIKNSGFEEPLVKENNEWDKIAA